MEEKHRELIEDLTVRFEHLKTERAKREPDWKEVQQLVAPSVFNWNNPQEKIPKRPRRYTSRPTHYLKTLVSGMTGYSVSPNIVWMKLDFEDNGQADVYGARDWLEDVERVMYTEFKRSNLYTQISKFVECAADYGHAILLVDEQLKDNRLRFTTHKISEVYLDTNEYDDVDTVFRYYSMTLKNAAAFFGEENLSKARQLDYKDKKNWNQELTIIHAVYPRVDADGDAPGAKNMPYASVYIDEGQEHLLQESGYTEFPYAVFIWDPVIGTAYGESPAIHALDDIRLLNKIDEARIKITQMSSDPAYNVPDTMRGQEDVVPGGFNYYQSAGEVIQPIQTGQNYPITLEINQAIENRVKDWFHVDFFLMLQHEGRNNMTATEVMELQGEKAAVLSDLVVNFNAALQKIVSRSFNLLYRQRKIPPMPMDLMGSGARMKVDFIGPLSQSQKKYHESGGIAQGMQLLGNVAQVSPTALDVVDFDQLVKLGLQNAGVSQLIIREDDDIAAIRGERAAMQEQIQQQQLALEEQKNIMGNANKMNEPVKQGSLLEAINQQMGGRA
jgi:hypothetical protein